MQMPRSYPACTPNPAISSVQVGLSAPPARQQGSGPEADADHRQLSPGSGADLLVGKGLGSQSQARPFLYKENDAEGLGVHWQKGPDHGRRVEGQVDWVTLSQPSLPRALHQADSFAPWSRGCPASHSLPRFVMNSLPLAGCSCAEPLKVRHARLCAQEHMHSLCTHLLFHTLPQAKPWLGFPLELAPEMPLISWILKPVPCS